MFTFIALLAWETKCPRQIEQYDAQRWIANFSLTLIPVVISFFVSIDEKSHLIKGLSIEWSEINIILSIVICLFLLDLIVYFLHRLSHKSKVLWRIHCLHHSDPALDISSNFRHHPLEFVWVLSSLALCLSLFNIPNEMCFN